MAIAITLREFNDLGRSVTAIFLWMGHFLYRFSTFCEKMKKIYRVEVLIFAKCSIEFRPFHLLVFSYASSRVKVCENDGNI